VLGELGNRTNKTAGIRLLSQAVDAYREALTIRTREALPQHYEVTR
jgi:hypothetical protein